MLSMSETVLFFIRLVKLLAAVLLLGMGVYFAINNTHDLVVRVPVTDQMISLNVSLALFLAFTVGTCFAVVFFGYEWLRKALDLKRMRKQLLEIKEKNKDSSLSSPASMLDRTVSQLDEDHSLP